MIPYQFINEFTVSTAMSIISTIIDERSTSKKSTKTKSTKKKKTTGKAKKKSSKKEDDDLDFFKNSSNIESDDYDDVVDDCDENEDDEETLKSEGDYIGYDYDESDPMVNHLLNFIELMNIFDDSIEAAYKQDSSAKEVYDKFDEYYAVIIPYAELVNVSYYKLFPSELKPNVEKLEALTNKLIDEFIGDIYDDSSIGLGVQLKTELTEIVRLANERIDEIGNGRPSFESIINNSDTESLDETEAK